MKDSKEFVYKPWECPYTLGSYIPPSLARKTISLPSSIELDEAIFIRERLTHIRKYNKEAIFSGYSYVDFMKIAELLDGSGELIESYLCYGFPKLNPSEERGDRLDTRKGKTFQFKESFITNNRVRTNFNHVQKWHEVDEYRMAIINRSESYRPYFFILTKAQMLEELKILNATSMDGTSSANKHNRRKYLKLPLPCKKGNAHFERWMDKYYSQYWDGAYGGIFSS